jgi:Domain of unknown function (DUF1905)
MSGYEFESALWEWGGKGSWHFVTVPEDISGIIRMSVPQKNGFGSIRVSASIDGRRWKTSLFPDAKSGCYFLPVKADIRRLCEIKSGDRLPVWLEVMI